MVFVLGSEEMFQRGTRVLSVAIPGDIFAAERERYELGYLDSTMENAIPPSPTSGRPAGRKTRVARTEDHYVLREIIANCLN